MSATESTLASNKLDSRSCILFQDEKKSVFLLDIPRSLEEAQVLPGQAPPRRILSGVPISAPFPTPEPKDADSRRHGQEPSALLADLMTGAAVKGAVDVLLEHHKGPFCLSRITRQNETAARSEAELTHFIPIKSHYFDGTVEEKRRSFIEEAPSFDLILLDPPWPNRSVKRKRDGYATASNVAATRSLLSKIPVASHLAADGLVAVWVTNKPSLVELLTATGTGMLTEWGLELVTEWTWLKITSTGKPMFELDSTWRKPWERLLIARRIGSRAKVPQRVLLAVPDIHSRKPNLRPVFDDVLPQGFVGLEVFARNLTAGWWSWGNEALRFQERNQWFNLNEVDTAGYTPRAPHDK
ncbi:MT-A70 family [Verticillium alfalfae VaMs.102]|uniref:MT-A70 family n=1 Tax=Verticillium alfalfae (strain VaMs.102 / ATCC MYA-4576 / FGSC 10136) TaxID=526221 RepID=C9S7M7_VERA1|nr:MT-A70 family [Verticillium alfalfae VaMs.102]EEY14788.1 MT-A70 family [Verticillium alfalfae VaMs.102]